MTMLEGFVEPQLRRLGIDPTALHFQQDGATAHTARNSMAVVREMFRTVISRFGDTAWPAQSPLLTKLRLLMRTYGGACMATSRHACNNALM